MMKCHGGPNEVVFFVRCVFLCGVQLMSYHFLVVVVLIVVVLVVVTTHSPHRLHHNGIVFVTWNS
jgi:hypothetical protein